jgi:hypothetical protein
MDISNNAPSVKDILAVPLAEGVRYRLDDADIVRVRARIYQLNQNNAAGWRWRTTKIAARTRSKNPTIIANLVHTLIVWRVK